MNLDDLDRYKKIDPQNMVGHIDGLPDQLAAAWELGLQQPLPKLKDIRCVVISGVGGSAIGADLLAAYVQPICAIPVVVHRDYNLPGFASGPETLVVCSSHSGNTEETLSGYELALERKCQVLCISRGGKLAERAAQNKTPFWKFEHDGQPRAAVGFSFGLLLALFVRLGLIADQAEALAGAVASMRKSQARLTPDILTAKNHAKRYAGQLMGRLVVVMASGYLAPVARRWKGQINEIAKSAAQFELLPEADHNTLQGLMFPENTLNAHSMTLFLRAPSDHPRNRLRSDLTRKAFMLEGLNTDYVDARGDSPLGHMWTMVLFGDYMAYYLAIAYGVDPTPIPALEQFKKTLSEEQTVK
ncbi:MAG TPA: bifunctional phosphoglucose/phosphomannose isomerase [Anaerolineales bacterium]